MGSEGKFGMKVAVVRKRLAVNGIIRAAFFFSAVFSAAYLLLLLLRRFTGLIPDYFGIEASLVPSVMGIVAGLLFARRPSVMEAARAIDVKLNAKDLFFTTALIGKSHGEYAPLVVRNAERESDRVRKSDYPFKWRREALAMVSAAALLLVLSQFLPQFDPFGLQAREKRKKENATYLKRMDEEVKERLQEIKKNSAMKNSKDVARALDELKDELAKLKLDDKKSNSDKLNLMQRKLADLMKEKNDEKLRDMLDRTHAQQSFGKRGENAREWKRQLEKGDLSGVKKEMGELRQMAEKLSGLDDPAEKRKMQEELARRMKDLANFAKSELGSKSVQAAMDTAMNELNMNDLEGLEKMANEALSNSLQLGERELERMEQMMNDMKSLESAMKSAQMAKMLNELDALKNANKGSLQDIGDYQKFYEDMMKNAQKCESCGNSPCSGDGNCPGNGEGKGKGRPGGPGKGGGFPGENEEAKTDFAPEVSKSKIQAGKILMEWKTKEVGDAGMAKEEYLDSVREVKQGVSEAIMKEQVPPGYHDAIKKYFDTMGKEKPD